MDDADVATTIPYDFAFALLTGAEETVPTGEKAATAVDVKVSENAIITVDVGSLSMSDGFDRASLVYAIKDAACHDMGECTQTATLQGRRRELQGRRASTTATVDVARAYSLVASPGASVPLGTNVEQAVVPLGANTASTAYTGLKASAVVLVAGTPGASAVDEAFRSSDEISNELALRLPGTALTVNEPTMAHPPQPPPLPPPPTPDGGGGGGAGGSGGGEGGSSQPSGGGLNGSAATGAGGDAEGDEPLWHISYLMGIGTVRVQA